MSVINVRFEQANSENLLEEARKLFKEYQSLCGINLCFQNFEDELVSLPGKYSPPRGRLYIAFIDENVIGCIALRPLQDRQCEMKRLYIRPEFRGQKLGRILAEKIITEARMLGYKQMFLDTLTSMKSAVNLYKNLGFESTSPYCFNPIENAIYMCLEL